MHISDSGKGGRGATLSEGTASPGRRYQTGKHLQSFLLLLIARRGDYGGALIERLRATLPASCTVDTGQAYRLLRSFEQEGLVVSRWHTQAEGAPLRFYEITGRGRLRLGEMVQEIRSRRDALERFLELWDAPEDMRPV